MTAMIAVMLVVPLAAIAVWAIVADCLWKRTEKMLDEFRRVVLERDRPPNAELAAMIEAKLEEKP